MTFSIRPAVEVDRAFLRTFMRERWGDEAMVGRERIIYPAEHPAFIAEENNEVVGVITYGITGDQCEVTSIDSLRPEQGIGGALMEAVIGEARQKDCQRVWLLTTNDNLVALKFYQKRGFQLVALYPNAMEQARRLKPAIPLIGESGIPLRDMLELEFSIGSNK